MPASSVAPAAVRKPFSSGHLEGGLNSRKMTFFSWYYSRNWSLSKRYDIIFGLENFELSERLCLSRELGLDSEDALE